VRKGIAGKHKVSPEAFMGECVDVEEEQYVLYCLIARVR
jgi:hypothetical protein